MSDNGGRQSGISTTTEEVGTTTNNVATTSTKSYSLKVPPAPTTEYVSLVDWPPRLYVLDEEYSCSPGGKPEARAGQTIEREIAGQKFCVTDEAEGAAGSIYHQYAYLTASPTGEVLGYTFSVREVQCLNYDEKEAKICLTDQKTFNPDSIARALFVNTIAE